MEDDDDEEDWLLCGGRSFNVLAKSRLDVAATSPGLIVRARSYLEIAASKSCLMSAALAPL